MVGMKDSGVEWIGEIPEEWGTAKLGSRAYMKGRIGWQGLRFDDFVDEGPYLVTGTDFCDGKVDWSCCYHINGEKYAQDPAIHLRNGDLLFTKDGTVGKLAYIDELPGPASLNSHLLVLRPKDGDVDNRYLFWLLQSSVFDRYKLLVQHGSVMDSISQTDMAHFIIPAPTANEQAAIVDYLDSSIDENDAAARAVETQISTLERYRASVIHEAVTRGLDPTAPTKPSNVDWIGNIPQGWETRRVKYVASIASGSTPSRDNLAYWDGDIPWVKTGELRNGLLSKTEEGITRKALVECSMTLYPAGTLLVAMYGQGKTRGMTAKLGVPCSINQACAALTPNESLVAGDYLWLCFIAGYEAIRAIAQGSGQPNLSADLIANFAIPLPPISEQGAIASVAFSRTAAIDAVIDTKRKQLDVLKRRRQSLIYEYVTGKRRVSEEA